MDNVWRLGILIQAIALSPLIFYIPTLYPEHLDVFILAKH